MEEQLISFETAKVAKEKGFNIECKNKYVETLEHTLEMGRGGDCTFAYQSPRVLSSRSYDKWDIIHCNAPTQSLLQKWLREVQNIHVKLHSSNTDIFSFEIYFMIYKNVDLNKKNLQNHKYSKINYSTYEEALEAGLQVALKLIK
jgi:hypothetical protein